MDIPKEMRNYYVGLVFRGDQYLTRGSPDQQALQERHLAFNRRCAEAGKYKAFGPITDNSDALAISVIEVASVEEALAFLSEDPAVEAGHFRVEAHPLFWPSLDDVKVEY